MPLRDFSGAFSLGVIRRWVQRAHPFSIPDFQDGLHFITYHFYFPANWFPAKCTISTSQKGVFPRSASVLPRNDSFLLRSAPFLPRKKPFFREAVYFCLIAVRWQFIMVRWEYRTVLQHPVAVRPKSAYVHHHLLSLRCPTAAIPYEPRTLTERSELIVKQQTLNS